MNSEQYCTWIRSYIHAINTNKVPNIGSAWEEIVIQECTNQLKRCKTSQRQILESWNKTDPSLSWMNDPLTRLEKLRGLRDQIINMYNSSVGLKYFQHKFCRD